jgi:hypothetical protein
MRFFIRVNSKVKEYYTGIPSQDSSEKLFEVSLYFFLPKTATKPHPQPLSKGEGGKGSFLGLEKSKRDEKTCSG